MLRITGYKKIFGATVVLEIADLILPANTYWLQGENGSGKTTFLSSVAGLLPFNGTIAVDSVSLKKNRRVYTGIVNHAAAEPVYPHFLTGYDLIQFYEKAKGGLPSTAKEIADLFGMTNYLHQKVATYSSGMTKKLSLLLAFIGHPKLILLDEPFTTLDKESVQGLQSLIAKSFELGISFCISSHQFIALPHVVLHASNKTIIQA